MMSNTSSWTQQESNPIAGSNLGISPRFLGGQQYAKLMTESQSNLQSHNHTLHSQNHMSGFSQNPNSQSQNQISPIPTSRTEGSQKTPRAPDFPNSGRNTPGRYNQTLQHLYGSHHGNHHNNSISIEDYLNSCNRISTLERESDAMRRENDIMRAAMGRLQSRVTELECIVRRVEYKVTALPIIRYAGVSDSAPGQGDCRGGAPVTQKIISGGAGSNLSHDFELDLVFYPWGVGSVDSIDRFKNSNIDTIVDAQAEAYCTILLEKKGSGDETISNLRVSIQQSEGLNWIEAGEGNKLDFRCDTHSEAFTISFDISKEKLIKFHLDCENRWKDWIE